MSPTYNGVAVSVSLPMLSNSQSKIFDNPSGRIGTLAAAAVRTLARALPQHCALCAAASGERLLCLPCARSLPALAAACPRCALPVPGSEVCGACLRHPPPYSSAIAAFVYAFPVDRLVGRLKYAHDLALAGLLAQSLAAAVVRRAGSPLPDLIVPLPLAPARQRSRGFNQAMEIARPLARQLSRPIVAALARERDGPAQAALARVARARNLRGAFAATDAIDGRHIAIVDDVMTTGATLSAAATACRRAGAARVDVWIVARTLPPGRT